MNDNRPSDREAALDARITELEMRLAFQEHTLGELNDALTEARLEGSRNAAILKVLMEDLGKMRNALSTSDPASEPPPPHY